MLKFLPRICSVSTAEVDWLSSANAWTGLTVRVELRGWGEKRGLKMKGSIESRGFRHF